MSWINVIGVILVVANVLLGNELVALGLTIVLAMTC
jgi:hypothetical protein